MTKKEKYLFIIEYLNDNLKRKEKRRFYRLLMNDSEFKMMFKRELELKKHMESMKYMMPSRMKKDVYLKIIKKKQEEKSCIVEDFSEMIFDQICQLTMPRMALGIINKTMKG